LVRIYGRADSGAAAGYLTERRFATSMDWADSDWDSPWLEQAYTWNVTDAKVTKTGLGDYVRPLLATSRAYWGDGITSGTSNSDLTSYAYTVYSGSSQALAVKKVTETRPTVSTGSNGSNATHYVYSQLRPDGQLELRSEKRVEAANMQIVEWRKYTANGQLSERISDADTSGIGGLDSDFTSASGETDDSEAFTYDAQGRQVTHATHDGRNILHYWSKLLDGRLVSIAFLHHDLSASPEEFSVRPATQC